jgi:hypothetical protein
MVATDDASTEYLFTLMNNHTFVSRCQLPRELLPATPLAAPQFVPRRQIPYSAESSAGHRLKTVIIAPG